MKKILSYVAASGAKKLDKKKGNYELIGCDMMINSNDKVKSNKQRLGLFDRT